MNKKEVNQLHSHIIKTTKKILNTDPLGTVQIGSIVESNLYGYKVQLNNSDSSSLFYADVIYPDSKYKTGDMVYLLKAEKRNGENLETKYFIFGLVDVVKQSYFNLSDAERFMMDESAQWLLNSEKSNLEINDKNIINSLKINLGLKLSCILTTKDKGLSEYGFKIDFLDKDGNTKTLRTFTDQDVNGAPFLLESSKQETVFVFTNEELDGVEKIVISFIGGDSWVEYLTLAAGELDTQITDFSVGISLQDTYHAYFKDTNIYGGPQSIGLQAAATYQGRELNTMGLKYYWFLEDKNIKKDSVAGFNALAGEGWRCLNETFKANTIINGISVPKTYWKADDNKYLLKYSSELNKNNLFNLKIKCIATYFYAIAESKEFIIKNYNCVNYFTKIEETATSNGSPLLTQEDQVVLKATVTADNPQAEIGEINWNWQYLNDKKEWVNIFEEGLVQTDTLTIVDRSIIGGIGVYEMNSKSVSIRCNPVFQEIGDNGEYDTIQPSETFIVNSFVQDIVAISAKTRYQYYISLVRGLTFESFSVSEGTFNYAQYRTTDSKERLIDVKNLWDKEALEFLQGSDIFNDKEIGKYFLYYTKQEIWTRNNELIKYSDWEPPIYLREVIKTEDGSIEDLKNENEIKQMNVFNSLSNGEQTQGVFYTDKEYSLTWDENPIDGKQYYVQSYNYNPHVKYPTDNSGIFGETYYVYIKIADAEGNEEEIWDYIKIDDSNKEDYLDIDDTNPNPRWQFKKGVQYYIDDKRNTKKQKISLFNDFAKGVSYWIWNAENNGYDQVKLDADNVSFSDYLIYYTRSLADFKRAEDSDFEDGGSKFKQDHSYYELISDKGDLYINATYIQTGTLRVGDKTKERFYVSLDSDEVRIAGFTVGEDEDGNKYLKTGEKGEENSVYLGTDGLFLGQYFKVNNFGEIEATSGKIAGFTIGNDGDGNQYLLSGIKEDSNSVYLGTDGLYLGDKFSVTKAGEITATRGKIAGFTIEDESLLTGKKNLLDNPSFSENTDGWLKKLEGSSGITAIDGYSCCLIAGNENDQYVAQNILDKIEPGKTYTYSIDLYIKKQESELTSYANPIMMLYFNGNYENDVWFGRQYELDSLVSSENEYEKWVRKSVQFTAPLENLKKLELSVYVRNIRYDVYFKNLKFEEGSDATSFECVYLGTDEIVLGANFKVDNKGQLTARDVILEGNIQAEGATLAGFTIGKEGNNSSLSFGTKSSDNSVYLGTDGLYLGTNFSVDKFGRLIAKSGEIGSFTIKDYASLYSDDQNAYIQLGNIFLSNGGSALASKGSFIRIGDKEEPHYYYANIYGTNDSPIIEQYKKNNTGGVYAVSTMPLNGIIGGKLSYDGTTWGNDSPYVDTSGSLSGNDYTITLTLKNNYSLMRNVAIACTLNGGAFVLSVNSKTITISRVKDGTESQYPIYWMAM